MKILRYQPAEFAPWMALDRLAKLRGEMNRLFETPPVNRESGSLGSWVPSLDVYEDKDAFWLHCEVPGMKKEEIELSFHDGVLTLSGERKSEVKEGESFRSERPFGKFQRSVTLPGAVDSTKISASYVNGVLKVELPKSEESKPKQISVSVS